MAQSPPKKPRRTRTDCFSGCLGPRRSDEATQFKARSNGGEKVRISWLYWPRFRSKKSDAKTVPVETSAPLVSPTVEAEKKEAHDKFNNPRAKSKSRSKPDRNSSKSRPAKQAAAAVETTARLAEPPEGDGDRETSGHEAEAHRNDTSRESRTDSARGNTWHNQKRLSFCRKIDAIRAGSSQPGSPDVKPAKTSRSSASAAAIPQSASLPILDPEPPPAPMAAPAPRPVQPQKNRKPRPATGPPPGEDKRVDPVVGMSIIMVTLVIMILWGRLCAILCTAVWFYFVPQLRSATERPVNGNGPGPDGPDLNSEEYKRRVVLEGLLERSRRSPP